jgi:hypothetical protein
LFGSTEENESRGRALYGLDRTMDRPIIFNFFFIGILFSGDFKPPLNRLRNITAFWLAGILNPLYLDVQNFLMLSILLGFQTPSILKLIF